MRITSDLIAYITIICLVMHMLYSQETYKKCVLVLYYSAESVINNNNSMLIVQ